eukprot:COSAG05_NODE_6546_length_940_cov_0.777646_1_plen_75_part_10
MAPAADFDTFSSIFEFYLQTLDFNAARTVHYFNHTGIFYTETKTLFGAFAVPCSYSLIYTPSARNACLSMSHRAR